jgi:hypothetical protein
LRSIDEIFNIDEVRRGEPANYYLLKDHKGEKLDGRAYEPELVKTRIDANTTYRIEKIIRKRKKNGINELEVKFFGYPEHYWIKESDVVN